MFGFDITKVEVTNQDTEREEFEVFRQELSEILDFLANKDKYIQAMDYYIQNKKNPYIGKYFNLKEK